MENNFVLQIKNLKKKYRSNNTIFFNKKYFYPVNDVTFQINYGQTLGLVGESGCGKSTLGKCILKLTDIDGGEIFFDSKNITKFSQNQMRTIRKDLQVIFQDPYSSLNPRMSIKNILEEPFKIFNIHKDKDHLISEILNLLDCVSLPKDSLEKFPHQFSGGQRQRICIARAIAFNPKLIICDESISALDVSIQAQIVNLLMDLQKKFGIAYLFISHDLRMVRFISDKIAVMNYGKIVEYENSEEIFENPKNEYTKKLLSSIPKYIF